MISPCHEVSDMFTRGGTREGGRGGGGGASLRRAGGRRTRVLHVAVVGPLTVRPREDKVV